MRRAYETFWTIMKHNKLHIMEMPLEENEQGIENLLKKK